jgi:hypothetical protein
MTDKQASEIAEAFLAAFRTSEFGSTGTISDALYAIAKSINDHTKAIKDLAQAVRETMGE